MSDSNRAIAFDVVSIFHVYSSIAAFLTFSDQSHLVIKLNRNKLGEFCLPERRIKVLDRYVNIQHEEKKREISFSLAVKFLLYLCGSIFPRKKERKCLIHHTYFKPTGLKYYKFKDLLGVYTVSFEEGVGTYGDRQHHREVAVREGKKLPGLSFLLKNILKRLVNFKFCVIKPGECSSQFSRSNFKLAVEIIGGYFYDDFLRKIIQNDIRVKEYCIYFLNPSFVVKDKTGESLENHVGYVMDRINEKNIYIKPHPLEKDEEIRNLEKLGYKVVPKDMPAELIFAIGGLRKIVGSATGSLLIAKSVYNIECYILPEFMVDESASMIKLFSLIKPLE